MRLLREKRVLFSHHSDPASYPKVDMLVQYKNSDVQFAVMESCLSGDNSHLTEDRLKIAKVLKNSLDKVAPHHKYLRFFGIQTQGTIFLDLNYNYKDGKFGFMN